MNLPELKNSLYQLNRIREDLTHTINYLQTERAGELFTIGTVKPMLVSREAVLAALRFEYEANEKKIQELKNQIANF